MDDNSCFNDLWIDGNDIFTLLQAIEGRELGHIVLPDFNNIIPMPQELDVDICTVPEHCAIAIAKENFEEFFNSNWAKAKSITTIDGLCEFLKTHWGGMSTIETVKRCGNMYLSNLEKYGFSDSSDWRKENWGTYSNAENTEVIYDKSDNLGIRFETFLDPPIKVIKALARQFPNNTFTLRYYDTNEGCEGCLKLEGERVEESRIEHHRWWKENRVVIAKVDLNTYWYLPKPNEDEVASGGHSSVQERAIL